MVLTHLKVFCFSKDDSTVHIKRKKKNIRQKNRCEDNIKEWTGMHFASLKLRELKNRLRWKGIVAKSSMVPQPHCKVLVTLV